MTRGCEATLTLRHRGSRDQSHPLVTGGGHNLWKTHGQIGTQPHKDPGSFVKRLRTVMVSRPQDYEKVCIRSIHINSIVHGNLFGAEIEELCPASFVIHFVLD